MRCCQLAVQCCRGRPVHRVGFMDVSYCASSHLRTFPYLPERFDICLKVCNLRYCKNFFVVRWRNVQSGSEASWYRNVQRCETSTWRTGKVLVAKRPVTKGCTFTTINKNVQCAPTATDINLVVYYII